MTATFLVSFIAEFALSLLPKLGLYWRGPLELLDGSSVEIVLLEDSSARTPSYSVSIAGAARLPERRRRTNSQDVEFPSARAALITTERKCNRALYRQRGHMHEDKFTA